MAVLSKYFLVLGGTMALHLMDVFSKYSFLIPVRPRMFGKAFVERGLVFSGSASASKRTKAGYGCMKFGRIKLQSQVAGAHP